MKGPERITRRGFAARAIPSAVILFGSLWPMSHQESVQLIMPMTAMAAFAYYMWASWGRLRDMGAHKGIMIWTSAPIIEAAITASIMMPMRPGDQVIASASVLFITWALCGFFYLLIRPGVAGENKYGEDPRPVKNIFNEMVDQRIDFGTATNENHGTRLISPGKPEKQERSLRMGKPDDQ